MEPQVLTAPPSKPMEWCGLDLFTFESKQYGLLVDMYSQFMIIKEFKKTPDTAAVISWLESLFHSQGWPNCLHMDGGPQMRTGMEEFCRRAKVEIEKSSIENTQSNSASEAGVKQAKGIFAKARMEGRSKEEALFMLQATPQVPGMLSPMRLFHGREPRIPELPALTDLRDEAAGASAMNQNKLDKKTRANLKTERFDTSPLDLEIGLQVLM